MALHIGTWNIYMRKGTQQNKMSTEDHHISKVKKKQPLFANREPEAPDRNPPPAGLLLHTWWEDLARIESDSAIHRCYMSDTHAR